MVSAAREVVYRVFDDNPERLAHSAGVAARAASLTDAVPEADAGLLIAAAWLHDIGYAPRLRDTGFHPIDGARYLRLTGWDASVCDLVAHHSGSRFVAPYRGVDAELREFTYRESPVADALTVADQTIGPNGKSLSVSDRLRDMLERHGPHSASARAHDEREAYIRAALERVSRRLHTAEGHDIR